MCRPSVCHAKHESHMHESQHKFVAKRSMPSPAVPSVVYWPIVNGSHVGIFLVLCCIHRRPSPWETHLYAAPGAYAQSAHVGGPVAEWPRFVLRIFVTYLPLGRTHLQVDLCIALLRLLTSSSTRDPLISERPASTRRLMPMPTGSPR